MGFVVCFADLGGDLLVCGDVAIVTVAFGCGWWLCFRMLFGGLICVCFIVVLCWFGICSDLKFVPCGWVGFLASVLGGFICCCCFAFGVSLLRIVGVALRCVVLLIAWCCC